MSAAAPTWVHGGPGELVELVKEVAPGEVREGMPDPSGAGDDELRVVLWAGPDAAGANAYTTCVAMKRAGRCRVWLAAPADDGEVDGLARYCLADGVLRLGDGALTNGEALRVAGPAPGRKRIPVDKLLQKLEGELAERVGQPGSPLGRPLAEDPRASLHERLTDPETGLFDGPFASFKLDEEFKRAMRFHQPLGLLLLDIGAEDSGLPADEAVRQELLADVAGVFLNECRDIDVLARFTETTFLFLLPGTGPAGTEVLAGRMLARLQDGDALTIALRPRAGYANVPDRSLPDRSAFLAAAEGALLRATAGEVRRADVAVGE